MIKVTQLNNKELIINAELISHIETAPNTIITLTTGNKVVVCETADDIMRRVIEYKRSIAASAIKETQPQ
jgi:flagellar protein FlbD